MNEIVVYKSEIEDGLKEKISSSLSVSSCAELEIVNPFEISEFKAIAENKDQLDLYYLKSILVSTGWNKNDDVFDRAEVWAARKSPEDKPFNYEHDQSQIIGHITACRAINVDGSIINDSSTIDELPSKFHITTSAVLYKYWEDQQKQERMNQIISELSQGKWFVSMEALFTAFDYAVLENGVSKVVARNEDTAFLTKHLRAYGGTGMYKDMKVGRLLKNITFSGKGLVRKPANPESVIFQETEAFKSNSGYVLGETTVSKEIEKMTDNQNELAEMQEQLKQIDSLNVSLSEANKKIEDHTAEAGMWQKEKDDMTQKMAESAKMYEELKATYEAALSELNNMKKEKKTNDRLSMVMEKMGMPKEEAITVVNSLETLADEAFANVVAMQGDYMKKKMDEYKSGNVASQVEVEVKPSNEDDTEEDPAESKASTSVLDTAEVKPDAALATSEVVDEVKQVASQIASYFGLDKQATE
jgi:hypothetical protein